jgi:hypothetical protein
MIQCLVHTGTDGAAQKHPRIALLLYFALGVSQRMSALPPL